MVKINLDIARNVLPYFIYKRFRFANFREYFSFKIDYGFGYWLRGVRIKNTAVKHLQGSIIPGNYLPTAGQESKIKLEFFDNANFKARQPAPFSAELISSPGSDMATAFQAPAAVDQDAYGVNMTAHPAIQSISNLNFLYQYGDIIRIDITGQNLADAPFPSFLDLLLIGYYVPQKTFEMYGGAE